MAVTLRVLDPADNLANHQKALRQTESLSFRLLSISVGRQNGTTANLVCFLQQASGPPAAPVSLETIDGNRDQMAQQAVLNARAAGRSLVCFGSLYVAGELRNVAVYR